MDGSDAASSVGDYVPSELGRADHSLEQGQDKDLLEDRNKLQSAVFGVMYTLSKEKYDDNIKFAIANILVDFLQLLVVIVHPKYGWSLDKLGWVWQVMGYMDPIRDIVIQGYHDYLVILYFMACALVGSCGLCIWVGWCFLNNRFPYTWPVKILRFVVAYFFKVFYLTVLSVMLMAAQCNFFNPDPHLRWTTAYFQKDCLQLPHVVHAVVAGVMMVAFIIVATIMTVADVDLNPLSRNLLASPTSMAELQCMLTKTALILSSSLLMNYPKLVSVLMAAGTWLLAYIVVVEQPFYNKWINHLRAALYGSLSWAALMLLIVVFFAQGCTTNMTITLFVGFVPALLLSFLISYVRLDLFSKHALRAFKDAESSEAKITKHVYKFNDEQEVELLSRCCRVWIDDDTLDEKAVKLSEDIIKAGMSAFNSSATLTILYSSFLIDIKNLCQSGHSQLQTVKSLKTNICQRFAVFVREQEHKQKSLSSSAGESTTDLTSYVEFQRNYRQLIRRHKGALYATRKFWKELLHSNVSFVELTRTFATIDQNQKRAEKMYRTILERYPSSPKIIRIYAKFLEFIKNDPWTACKYYSDADKLDEEAEAMKNAGNHHSVGAELGLDGNGVLATVDDNKNPVILCNSTGVMQMTNKAAHELFGYKKGEMEGKNVSILMPAPVSQLHGSYLRAYITTGKEKLLNSVREVVALHKDRFMFAVRLSVTKLSGSGIDTIFMAVLVPVEDDATTVRCWCSSTGKVICISQRFTDWFGNGVTDVIGKPISSLVSDQSTVAEFLQTAVAITDKHPEQSAVLAGVKMLHKYTNEPVEVNLTCWSSGDEAHRILIFEIQKCSQSAAENLLVTDHSGGIIFATNSAAAMLGYTVKAIVRQLNVSNLMDNPFSQLHSRWLKDPPSKPPRNSCRSSAMVLARTSNGSCIPVRLKITCREGDESQYIISMTKCKLEDGIDLQRLQLQVDVRGVVLEVSQSPSSLFGFPPARLIGKRIDTFINTMHELHSEGVSVDVLMAAMINRITEQPACCWRVGVHPPVEESNSGILKESSVAACLLNQQTKPAVLQMEVIQNNAGVQVAVSLQRADAVTGVLEVLPNGCISSTRLSPLNNLGLIFGLPLVNNTSIRNFINIGSGSLTDCLLSLMQYKGGLKSKRASGTKVGPKMRLHGCHVDGCPLQVDVQACSKDASSVKTIILKVNVAMPSKGSTIAFKKTLLPTDQYLNPSFGWYETFPSIGIFPDVDAAAKQAPMQNRSGQGGNVMASGAVSLQPNHQPAGLFTQTLIDVDLCQFSQEANGGLIGVDVLHQSSTPPRGGASAAGEQGEDFSCTKVDTWMSTMNRGLVEGVTLGSTPEGDTSYPLRHGHLDTEERLQLPVSRSEPSLSSLGSVQQTDFKKGKRFRKLSKMIGGRKALGALHHSRSRVYILVTALLAVHLACFAGFIVMLKSLHRGVYETDSSGEALGLMSQVAMDAVMLRVLHQGRVLPGNITKRDMDYVAQTMLKHIEKFEKQHEGVYLGFNGLRRLENVEDLKLRDLWENPSLPAKVIADVHPLKYETSNMSLWRLGRQFAESAREVMANHATMGNQSSNASSDVIDIKYNPDWYFVVENGPNILFTSYKTSMDGLVYRSMEQIQRVNKISMSLLVLEGCVISIVAVIYTWILVQQVAIMRYRLVSVFLTIPTGFLRALATKQIHVDGDDEDNSDSDDGDALSPAPPPEVQNLKDFKKGHDARGMSSSLNTVSPGTRCANYFERLRGLMYTIMGHSPGLVLGQKRKLVHDSKDSVIITLPFALWSLLVLVTYAVSYVRLSRSVHPLIDNNIADRLKFRILRAVFLTVLLCTSETSEEKATVRPLLDRNLFRLQNTYDALMIGKAPFDDSRWATTGTTFRSDKHSRYFFRQKNICVRSDKSTCFNSTNKYYQISSMGLDNMLDRLLEEARLLSRDQDVDVNATSPRLDYIWNVCYFDLREGMKIAVDKYTTTVLYAFDSTSALHVMLFVASWILALLFVLAVFHPFLRRVAAESRRVAELLSQLPPEMDVAALVDEALGRTRELDVHQLAAARSSAMTSFRNGKLNNRLDSKHHAKSGQ